MQQQTAKLVYLSCQRAEHLERSLDSVCIDSSCSCWELVCSCCKDTLHLHKGHRTLPLKEFIDMVQNLKYAQHTSYTKSSVSLGKVKQMKADLLEQITTAKKQVQETMNNLDQLIARFQLYENQLIDENPARGLDFFYSPSLPVIDLNRKVKSAVQALTKNEDRQKNMAVIDYLEGESEFVNTNLSQLLKTIRQGVDTILSSYTGQTNQTIRWSQALKHPDIQLESQRTKAFRGSKSPNTQQVIVLSEAPLIGSCSWKVKLPNHEKLNWIGLGIFSVEKARCWKFCDFQRKKEKACVIPCNGTESQKTKALKAGKRFKFNGKNETINICYSREKRQLRFEKSTGEWCVLDTSTEEHEALYACAMIQSVGSECGVQICQ